LEAYDYAFLRETDDKAEKILIEQKAKIEIARKLIKRNLTNEEIAEDTGLTLEQVEQLRNKK
jgi:predicted transposase/invertase (TIGR01784 family)